MNQYQDNVNLVLEWMKNVHKSEVEYNLHRSCFRKLCSYLTEAQLSFSPVIAHQWIDSLDNLSDNTIKVYQRAIQRLDDIYNVGHIRFNHVNGIKLRFSFQKTLDDFLPHISSGYTKSQMTNIVIRCRFFFRYLQIEKNMNSPYEIDYQQILDFYYDALCSLSRTDRSLYKGSIQDFLKWMAEESICPYGVSLLLSYNWIEKILLFSEISGDEQAFFIRCGKTALESFPPDAFMETVSSFLNELKNLGYASTMMSAANSTLNLLYLFLDMNHLGYSHEISMNWFSNCSNVFGTNAAMSRRVLMLFSVFVSDGKLTGLQCTFCYMPRGLDKCPDWCRSVVSSFLEQKHKEEKAPSTVSMYCSAVIRFCNYLTSQGICEFSSITAEIIKDFNQNDKHATIEGKNAYNVRIRKFLFYLFDRGYIDNYFLINTIPCKKAPRVKVVQTLNEEQYILAGAYGKEDDADLVKRDRVILLMGLKMGMRGSDIVALTSEQIDWENSSIRFIQKKTGVENILPMPVEVGNALYIYLTTARPVSDVNEIFISHKAPYKGISRAVCNRIFSCALPEWNIPGTAFHVTRKTFATKLFQNGVRHSLVADLLGHSTTDTVYKYISLDEERMRLCPISLGEGSIQLKGGFRDEP